MKHKRIISIIASLSLMFGLFTGCTETPADNDNNTTTTTTANENNKNDGGDSNNNSESGLASMTGENIKLRYAFWGQSEKGETEVTQAQIKAFTEAYPNIEVEFVSIDQDQWNESLQNMAATGQLPDVFGVYSVSDAVLNEWALPLDEFYNNDKGTAEMYESFAENSKINGVRYSMPWVMFPHLVFVNKTMFEKYNEPLPSYDWTVDDYFEIASRITHPEDFYFGVSNPIYEDLFPAWYNGGQGKWGWNGTSYSFDQVWIDAINKKYELIDSQVCEWAPAEDKEKFLGDPEAWPPGWGRVAMHIDWPWSIAYFEDVASVQSGSEFLYYPLPKGESGEQLVIVDNAVISASTKYPREAWELLKWTTWGEEAQLTRQQAYRDAGANVSRMPVTTNENVWNDLINNTDREDLKALYNSLRSGLVPSPWPVSPGWGIFETWVNEQDIYGKIDRREISPADVAGEMQQKANEARDQYISQIP